MYELEKFRPFLFEEMYGDVVQLDVIGYFTVRFFRFPCDEIFGLRNGIGVGFIMVVAHLISPGIM
jgi:hypothetical protein